MITLLFLLFSSASFAQTASGEDIYQPPSFVVSGTDFAGLTGCWAKIHEREDFAGRSLTIVGYTNWPVMSANGWPDWSGRVKSAQVGPSARLILYGQPYFADEDNTITRGVEVSNIPEVPAGDAVESLRLLCDPN